MCGKRLNDWKTIPISRRTRLMSTPGAVISSAGDHDPSRVDRLEEVDAAKERRLARAGRADEAHDLVLGERQVDAAEHLELAEGLVDALEHERMRPISSDVVMRASRPAVDGGRARRASR